MANTNKGRKLYICETPKASDLSQSQYEALTWVEVMNVGMIGVSGTATNVLSYDELATEVTQKQKGISNAGDPDIEVSRNPTDAGQIALRTAAATKYAYAFKVEDADAPSASYTNSIYYNRGIITRPKRPNGRNEDFVLEIFTLGLVQLEIVVDPAAQVVTANVLPPAIIGAAAQTGVLLTAYEGTWTLGPVTYAYQWQKDTAGNGTFVAISGATASTYTPLVGNVGNALRLAVTATNGEGTPITANSLPTQVQIAA